METAEHNVVRLDAYRDARRHGEIDRLNIGTRRKPRKLERLNELRRNDGVSTGNAGPIHAVNIAARTWLRSKGGRT